jgi:hypothetical protein
MIFMASLAGAGRRADECIAVQISIEISNPTRGFAGGSNPDEGSQLIADERKFRSPRREARVWSSAALPPGFELGQAFCPTQVPMVFATPGGSDSRDRFRAEISGRLTCAALIKLAANKTTASATGQMSALGLGCVKTPATNLRVEIPSRFRQFENQKCLRPLLGEDDRENNSAHSRLGLVFTQPGSTTDLPPSKSDFRCTPKTGHRRQRRPCRFRARNGSRPIKDRQRNAQRAASQLKSELDQAATNADFAFRRYAADLGRVFTHIHDQDIEFLSVSNFTI